MKIFKILFYSLVVCIISYMIVDYGINYYNQDYKIEISESDYNYDNIQSKDYWDEVFLQNDYENKYGITSELYNTMKIEEGYLIIDGNQVSFSNANIILRKLLNNGLSKDNELFTNNQSIIINRISPILVCLITTSITFLICFFLIKKEEESKINVFSKEYWVKAAKETKVIRNLCFSAILIALQMVVGLITIPSGFANLGIGLSYIVLAINCMLFGPVHALLIGFVGDSIGYMLSPSPYGYFFGYTLNAMIAAFTYGIFFYKSKISFTKVLITRVIVNIFVNVILGTLWWSILMGYTTEQAFNYLLYISLPKNMLYLIPQSVVLFLVIKSSLKLFFRQGFIEEEYVKAKII